MKNKLTRGIAVALTASLSLSVGCVSTGFVKSQARVPVRFETASGAQMFYEAYIAKNYTYPMGEHGYLAVGVELPYSQHEYATDSVYFNASVSAADTDHDGVISDDEARRYAKAYVPSGKALWP